MLTDLRRVLTGLILIAAVGCNPTGSFKITALPRDLTVEEEVVTPASGFVSDRIAVIDVSGVLMNAHMPGLFTEGEHPVSFTVEKLAVAAKDRRVKAVVLRINSPGGSVTASDSLYQEVLEFKKKTGKPVIAYFQDVAASGAYYMACATDEIMAQRTTVTGSIGVVMQMMDVSRLFNLVGLSADAIKSGAFKDSGSPFRPMRADEREVFQGLVDGFYKQFVGVVQAGRPKLTHEKILKLADGRVYTAEQALENGLIDRIGTMNEAVESAKNRAGIKAANVVMYHRPLDWTPNIYASGPGGTPQAVNLFNVNLPSFWTRQPRFMYIWSVEG